MSESENNWRYIATASIHMAGRQDAESSVGQWILLGRQGAFSLQIVSIGEKTVVRAATWLAVGSGTWQWPSVI